MKRYHSIVIILASLFVSARNENESSGGEQKHCHLVTLFMIIILIVNTTATLPRLGSLYLILRREDFPGIGIVGRFDPHPGLPMPPALSFVEVQGSQLAYEEYFSTTYFHFA